MKFTLSWLKDHLDTQASLTQISEALTSLGLEVESITDHAERLKPFIVAEIKDAQPHPQADRLRVCSVSNGRETMQIVCGAPNARAGIKVVLAPVGTFIPGSGITIKKSAIRGVESNGMLCSAEELGLGGDSEGIIELPADAVVGGPASAPLGADDAVIEIAITPNRADCLGVYGIARDLAAKGLGALTPRSALPLSPGERGWGEGVTLETEACPYYIGVHFKGVKNAQSPEWLKNRLTLIGQKPISALVDITNYITFDQGRPLHVYDVAKLSGGLSVRAAKAGEKLLALNDKEYTFEGGELVIADGKGPIAIAGIIGGKETGVSEATTDVFLEVAYFEPTAVRKLGQKLQIDSDAKYRFERGVDPEFLATGAALAAKMIQELCGGQASAPVIAGKSPFTARSIAFDVARVETLGGVKVEKTEAEKILAALGFAAAGNGQFAVPSYRADVEGEADLVEEVLRVKGYEHITEVPLPNLAPKKLAVKQQLVADMRRLLVSRGMTEGVTFSFMDSTKAEIKPELLLQNPISSELNGMRPSILPNLLDAYQRNAARGLRNTALVEIGPVYEGVLPEQNRPMAAGLRTGETAPKNHYRSNRPVDAFDAKADLFAAIALSINPEKLQLEPGASDLYHPGRSGKVMLGQKLLGYFGELHPGLKLEDAAVGFELYLDQLPAPAKAAQKPEISDFQAVSRDFAFVVAADLPVASLIKAISNAEKSLIREVAVFDVYQGKGLAENQKSIAISVLLQAPDRTLEAKEIEAAAAAICTAAEKNCAATLRS